MHNSLHVKLEQLSYECLIVSFTGWVYYEHSAVGRKISDGAKDLHCVARTEGDFVCEAIEFRIVRCEAYRVRGELDAGDLGEVRGECEREEACATVCVYQVCWGSVLVVDLVVDGNTASQTYEMSGTRTELLF